MQSWCKRESSSMPAEIIGEFGTPGAHPEWLEAEGKLAIRHLKSICGEPLLECS